MRKTGVDEERGAGGRLNHRPGLSDVGKDLAGAVGPAGVVAADHQEVSSQQAGRAVAEAGGVHRIGEVGPMVGLIVVGLHAAQDVGAVARGL